MIPGSEPVTFTVQEPGSAWAQVLGVLSLLIAFSYTDYRLWRIEQKIGTSNANSRLELYTLRDRCRDDAQRLLHVGGWDKTASQPIIHFNPRLNMCLLQIDHDGGVSGIEMMVIDVQSGEILIKNEPYLLAKSDPLFAKYMGSGE